MVSPQAGPLEVCGTSKPAYLQRLKMSEALLTGPLAFQTPYCYDSVTSGIKTKLCSIGNSFLSKSHNHS